MADIKVGIIVDDKGATKSLKDFDTAMNKVGADAKKVNDPLKATSTNLKNIGTAAKASTTAVNNSKASISSLAGSLSSMNPVAGKVTAGFSQLGNVMKVAFTNPYIAAGIVAIGTALGGLVITSKLAQIMDQMKDTADAIGITVQQYQAMNAMLIANGSNMDKFSGAFATFQDKVGSADKIFKQYGITVVDNKGNLKDTLVVQDEFLKRVSKMATETEKIVALRDAYGKKGTSLLGSLGSEEAYINAKKMADAMVIPTSTVVAYTKIGDMLDMIKGFTLKSSAGIFKPVADSFTDLLSSLSRFTIIKTVVTAIMTWFSRLGTYVIQTITATITGIEYLTAKADRMRLKYSDLANEGIAGVAEMDLKQAVKSKAELLKINKELNAIDQYARMTQGLGGRATLSAQQRLSVLGAELNKKSESDLIKYKQNLLWKKPKVELDVLSFEATNAFNTAAVAKRDAAKKELEAARMNEAEAEKAWRKAGENVGKFEKGSNIPELETPSLGGGKPKSTVVEEKKKEDANIIGEEIDFREKNKSILKGFSDFVFNNRKDDNEEQKRYDQISFDRANALSDAKSKLAELDGITDAERLEISRKTLADINAVYDQQELDTFDEFSAKHSKKMDELNQQQYQSIVDAISLYAGYTSTIINSIMSISQVKSDNIMKDIETERSSQMQSLEFQKMTDRRRSQMTDKINADAQKKKDEQFAQDKKRAIAQALINGALGVTNAWANGGTWVSNIIESGVVTAATVAEVAVISAQRAKDSGIIGGATGASPGEDNQMVYARKGEMFLNSTDQRTLFNGIKSGNLGGSGGSVQIQQGNIIVQGGANQSAIDQIKAETQRFSNLVKETVLDLQYRRQLSFA